MGKQKKSGNRLAAQIAAEEREDDQVMLAPQQSADAPDESSAVNAAALTAPGRAAPEPTRRSGPTRSSSVPRMPSE